MTTPDPTFDELKNIVFEFLRANPKTQALSIVSQIQNKIGRPMSDFESHKVLELINELIISNILITALDFHNTGWPWLSLTTHGQNVLKSSGAPVYDYEGFISELKLRVPKCDIIVEKYVSEALRAFQSNLFYASMVMLGCASERAISLLIEAYIESVDKTTNKERLRSRILKRDISTAYDEFKKSFDSTRIQVHLSKPINDFDSHVDSVFTFIRLLRNSIVHPSATPQITSSLVYSNLQQFSYYISTIFELIEYYKANKTVL